MAIDRAFSLGELQLKVSPFLQQKGSLLRSLNVQRDSIGAYQKRPGYTTYLGTPDNSQVNTLFSWTRNNGTTLYTYRYSGSVLYYSTQGTGDWTVCGAGTFTPNSKIGYTSYDDVMIVGDGTAVTRHTTTGTSFTTTSGAPLSSQFVEYQGRIYSGRGTATAGTDTNLFYSTTGTVTDWTTDSSSIRIPGEGRILSVFKANDKVVITKTSGLMYKWDGYSLIDNVTDFGPTSPYSIADVEGYKIYLNRRGIFGYGGNRPEILSNPIQRQIYNDLGSGITGANFSTAPAEIFKYDYMAAVGTITDDLTDQTISDCILRYNYQQNEWGNWKFANNPTAMHSYTDASGDEQFIWGDSGGQCYKLSGTALSDNGQAIESVLMGMLHYDQPETEKKFNYIWAFTNPGCQAKIQVAIGNTFTKGKLNWIDLKQTSDGVMEARFPSGSQGRLLFWKLYESSKASRYNFYGFSTDVEFLPRNG